MIERVVGELMDVHPDLRVKEAALRWLRHGSVPDSDLFRMVAPTGLPHLLAMACSTYTNYRPQRVLELAADSPTRIRVLALQVLPWIVGPELALEVVIETAFAAVMVPPPPPPPIALCGGPDWMGFYWSIFCHTRSG
jgi:hypothetical protein